MYCQLNSMTASLLFFKTPMLIKCLVILNLSNRRQAAVFKIAHPLLERNFTHLWSDINLSTGRCTNVILKGIGMSGPYTITDFLT